MLPAQNKGVGMNVGFPDVCATPPAGVPVPYPNMAMNATAIPFAIKVFFSFVNALNMGSQMPITLGDQPGTMSPFMGPGRYTMGNPKVFLEALPGINLTCPASGNNMVAGSCIAAVASVTNVFLSHAGAVTTNGSTVDMAWISQLSHALRPLDDEWVEALLSNDVAYLRVPVFSLDVAARVYDMMRRMSAWGANALVVDLRQCPGGDLTAAIDFAGDFLKAGEVIATVVDGDGDETVYRAQQENPYEYRVFVLVDGGTASAAEVFAGCLQSHGRAVVIGERTYGKGSTQALLAGYAEPGAHYATVATVVLPKGQAIEGRGITPDVEVTEPLGPAVAADLESPEAISARLAADAVLASALVLADSNKTSDWRY